MLLMIIFGVICISSSCEIERFVEKSYDLFGSNWSIEEAENFYTCYMFEWNYRSVLYGMVKIHVSKYDGRCMITQL